MKECFDKEFVEFAKDHIKHFNTIPLEFEDSSGNVIDSNECWDLASKYNLQYLIKKELIMKNTVNVLDLENDVEYVYCNISPIEALISASINKDKKTTQLTNELIREEYRKKVIISNSGLTASIDNLFVRM